MRIPELINLMQNNLGYLQNQKAGLVAIGDVAGCMAKDDEIAETNLIIARLQRVD